MSWLVDIRSSAVKQLEAIPPDRRRRIVADINELERDPFRGLVKLLKGPAYEGFYRKVSGRYRIIFRPVYETRIVYVLAVLLRNEATYK